MMLAFMYQALSSPGGIILEVSNFNTARARCYAERAQSGDPSLNRLQFRQGPTAPGTSQPQLWIVKGPEREDTRTPAPLGTEMPNDLSAEDLELDIQIDLPIGDIL